MSVAQQAKRGRKKARMDPRYCHKGKRDTSALDRKRKAQIDKEKAIAARRGLRKK